MRWLQNNVPGLVLASACGVLVLVAVILSWAGTRPPAASTIEATDLDLVMESRVEPDELEALGAYRVVTDRPLFNPTRRPVIEVDLDEQLSEAEEPVPLTEAPDVSLTGVVITPDVKLVSLTPAGGGEAVVFGEGKPMRGEYNGWVVSEVLPRAAVLESADGQRVQLSLVINQQKLKEPPRPVPQRADQSRLDPDENEEDEGEYEDGDDERMSRAEEIRQRIAERREQLRQQAAENDKSNPEGRQAMYAESVRSLIYGGNDDREKDDDENQ